MRLPASMLAALILLTAACGGSPRQAQAVVLVTLDTTRADRIGCYGNSRIQTPVLDSIAREGVLFEQAAATAPLTLPSHASMMTGRYPPSHGVRNNGMFIVPKSERTLAEVFMSHGYDTGAFVGAFPLSAHFGLGQGFHYYDENFDPEKEGLVDYVQRDASEVNAAALPWIATHRGRKFFLWVHYYDPHYPYRPPPPYDRVYSGVPYDGEIAFADSQIGSILSAVEKVADPSRTVLAVLGDHGESLGEHGEDFHGLLIYEATTRIPFLLRAPGLLPAGARVSEPVSAVDLFPTLLHLAGIEGEISKGPPVHGLDLFPLVTAPGSRPREGSAAPVIAESLLSYYELGWSELYSIRSGRWKYIEAPRPELYDLASDPSETRNLLEPAPGPGDGRPGWREQAAARAASLKTLLAQQQTRFAASSSGAGAASTMDAKTAAKLQSLGYVQGIGNGPAGAARSTSGKERMNDPKDFIQLYQQIIDAGQLYSEQKYEQAASACLRLLTMAPASSRLQQLLAESLLNLKRFDELDRLARPLLDEEPSHFWVPGTLARAREQQGDREGAIALYRLALRRNGDFPGFSVRIAQLLFEMGRYGDCLEQAGEILGKYQNHVPAMELKADCLMSLGEKDKAIASWKRVLEIDPEDTRASEALAASGSEGVSHPSAQQAIRP